MTETAKTIEAEIQALKVRIKRLRLEKRLAMLVPSARDAAKALTICERRAESGWLASESCN